MSKNVYIRLAEAFDKIGFGMPKTKLRFEKFFLRSLYSKEDAQVALGLVPNQYATPRQWTERNGGSVELAAQKLESLAKRGLLYRRHRGEEVEYRIPPLAFGLMEFQAENPSHKWILPMGIYMLFSTLNKKRLRGSIPFYRTIPIKSELVNGSRVLPYDDLDALLSRHTRFTAATCWCRSIAPVKCGHPIGTCITTDDMAVFFRENGWGRELTRDETKALLQEGDKDGRIIQIQNSQNAENICSCCACGCAMLQVIKKIPASSDKLASNYYAVVNNTTCVLCGKCQERCPFDAISNNDKKVEINTEKCFGCGLCVSTCASNSLSLVRKPDAQLYEPPLTMDVANEIRATWKAETEAKGIKI
jgi:Pyruvate/2-oxoacid:ferredoxin oxidoreductase delta subunit